MMMIWFLEEGQLLKINRILADQHMHTCFSFDSKASPEDMIKSAIEKGLRFISITDHYDMKCLDYEEDGIFDAEEYFKTLLPLKEKYQDRLQINIGIELGLQSDYADFFSNLLKKYPFEFIIGSTHVIEKRDPAFGYDFKYHSDQQVYQKYLEEEYKNIKSFKNFHVLGHLDYVIRYGNKMQESFCYDYHKEIIDLILKELIDTERGIEINTAGIKYGLKHPHPGRKILERYKALGGDILTIGSDAHDPSRIGNEFVTASRYAKDCGFKYYTIFRGGNREFYQLP